MLKILGAYGVHVCVSVCASVNDLISSEYGKQETNRQNKQRNN